MTLPNERNEKSFIPQGVSNEVFDFDIVFFDTTDLAVFYDDGTAGEIKQTLSSDYTVTGGNGNVGTVVWVGTSPVGGTIRIIRDVPATQTEVFPITGAFPATTNEKALDKQAAISGARMGRGGEGLNANVWDAQGDQIKNVGSGTDTTDAANVQQVQDLIASSGNLPAPIDGQQGYVLLAGPENPPVPFWDPGVFQVSNAILNGAFHVNQRAQIYDSSAIFPNVDGGPVVDRWNIQSDGADVFTVRRGASIVPPPNNDFYAELVWTAGGAGNKGGIAQIIESSNTAAFKPGDGETTVDVTYSIAVQTSSTNKIDNVRVAVLGQTNLSLFTSILVSSWNSAGADPTLDGDWIYLGTPQNHSFASDDLWVTLTGTVQVPQGLTDMALFVWSDDTNVIAGDTLRISNAQLVRGAVAPTFKPPPLFLTQLAVQRYFDMSWPSTFAAGTNTPTGSLTGSVGNVATGNIIDANVRYPVELRTAGTSVLYSVAGTAGSITNLSGGGEVSASVSSPGTTGFQIALAAPASPPDLYQFHYYTDAEFQP